MLFFIVCSGAVVLGRYAQRKLLEYQDREAAEYLAQFRLLLLSLQIIQWLAYLEFSDVTFPYLVLFGFLKSAILVLSF